MTKSFPLRVRSVRMKDGGAHLRVLHRPDRAKEARAEVEKVLKAHGSDYAGLAIVVWASDGSSTARLVVNDGSSLPSIYAPDFVRNRLLAERIESWTLDTINGR